MQIAAAIRAFTETETYLEPTKVLKLVWWMEHAGQEKEKEKEEEVEGPEPGNEVNTKL